MAGSSGTSLASLGGGGMCARAAPMFFNGNVKYSLDGYSVTSNANIYKVQSLF
jgi:hypothetical protein